jgi:serine/threonine protein kinase
VDGILYTKQRARASKQLEGIFSSALEGDELDSAIASIPKRLDKFQGKWDELVEWAEKKYEKAAASKEERKKREAEEAEAQEERAKFERWLSERESQQAPTKASSKASTIMGDRYRRGKLIGEGGMSNVYRAEDADSGDAVIWKESAPSRFNPLKEVNRSLSNESEALGSLSHPRIPRRVDEGEFVNETGQSVRVLVMELIGGASLKSEMEMLIARGNTLGKEDSFQTLTEVCEALEYMADQDPPLYHRDIKPANIIANPERGTVLIDFGLAKGVVAGADVSLSRGASEGWSPPERRDGVSGPFTDVYSLGQVLWHLLTGERPFHVIDGDERAILSNMGHPDWIADLLKMTSLPFKNRIQTTVEFRIRLENEGEMP